MSMQAIKYKEKNSNIDFKKLSLSELNKLPNHIGIIDFKITKTSFLILNVLNDDSSAVKFFWHDTHDLESLDLWFDISKKEGLYIDVGAHTGLYTLTSLKSNPNNQILAIEPFYLNMARLISNLRLNNFFKNIDTKIIAASNQDGISRFNIGTHLSYLSKGGKIDEKGEKININKIDTITKDIKNKKIRGIKIDTEGEDYKVLLGAKKTIEIFRPKIIIEVRNQNKNKIQNFFSNAKYKLFDVSKIDKPINLNEIEIPGVLNIFAEPIS